MVGREVEGSGRRSGEGRGRGGGSEQKEGRSRKGEKRGGISGERGKERNWL